MITTDYPKLAAANIVDFLKLVRRGHKIKIDEPEPGMDRKKFDQQHQQNEFLKSIEHLRKHAGTGLKASGR